MFARLGRVRLCRVACRRAAATPRRCLSTAFEPSRDSTLVDEIVDAAERRILTLFERFGAADYIGEPCSITEHSVQAANAAAKAGESETAILACLLHDVGHLAGLEAGHAPGMDGCGTPEHERVGAELLGALGLPVDVSYLTHKHVSAKRYLCATQPDYYHKLTDASKTTLKHQGGPMSAAEAREAEADPRWPMVLRMRGYDEAGKDVDAAFTSPSQFVPMLRAALRDSVSRQLELRGPPSAYPLSPHAASYVFSEEQLRYWDEHGMLVVRGALPSRFDAHALSAMADEAAALPRASCYPWLLHHERSALDSAVRICRVENFCKHHTAWGELAHGLVADLVSQAFREPAVLFKDKINFKGVRARHPWPRSICCRPSTSPLLSLPSPLPTPPSFHHHAACGSSNETRSSIEPLAFSAGRRRLPRSPGCDSVRDRRPRVEAHLGPARHRRGRRAQWAARGADLARASRAWHLPKYTRRARRRRRGVDGAMDADYGRAG